MRFETAALRQAAPGPGNWATPEDLWNLHCLGMPRPFRSLAVLAKAAQLRLLTTDNAMHGGMQVEELHAAGIQAAREHLLGADSRVVFHWLHDSI